MFAWRAFPQEPGASPGAYLTVPALARSGIRVAFTTRHGGRSDAPFDSLNLSYASGDDPERVRANRRRALAAVGGALESWTGARQVHSATPAHADAGRRGAGWSSPADVIPDADAVWTDTPDVTVVVLTADCVPIVLADPSGRRVGAVHAGWRGLLAGVVERTVDAMGEAGRLSGYVGPSIGPCCYVVGDEVARPAIERFGDVVRTSEASTRLDLWACALRALADAGVREVWPAALCTRCERHRFFSHRAGSPGRQGVLARIAA